jgi:hypothetical protein
MAKLTQAQIQMYAQSAGMANPQVMAAIAMAESGGDPMAHNVIPPDNSYGLWQVNMIGSMGAARRKQFGIVSNDALYNPAVNARAAAVILKEQGLSAWSTYTSGAYKKYLNSGSSGVGSAQDASWWNPLEPFYKGLEAAPQELDLGPLGDAVSLFGKFGEWTSNPRNWLNVAYVILGGAVIIMAVSSTVRAQAVNAVTSTYGKVLKK